MPTSKVKVFSTQHKGQGRRLRREASAIAQQVRARHATIREVSNHGTSGTQTFEYRVGCGFGAALLDAGRGCISLWGPPFGRPPVWWPSIIPSPTEIHDNHTYAHILRGGAIGLTDITSLPLRQPIYHMPTATGGPSAHSSRVLHKYCTTPSSDICPQSLSKRCSRAHPSPAKLCLNLLLCGR